MIINGDVLCSVTDAKNFVNNNTLSQNNFINNTNQISTNEWYAQQWGYGFSNNILDQNYWSNYNGTDSNTDGIGDTSYTIDENNQDNTH